MRFFLSRSSLSPDQSSSVFRRIFNAFKNDDQNILSSRSNWTTAVSLYILMKYNEFPKVYWTFATQRVDSRQVDFAIALHAFFYLHWTYVSVQRQLSSVLALFHLIRYTIRQFCSFYLRRYWVLMGALEITINTKMPDIRPLASLSNLQQNC